VGALVYVAGGTAIAGEGSAILGLILVTVGQTAGILNAVSQY